MASYDKQYALDEVARYSEREPRQRTLMRAVMTLPGLSGSPVMVRNVSENGMRLASKALLPREGETIALELDGSPDLKGHVRWVRGQEFGVRLSHPLDLRWICLANQRRNGDMADTLGGQVESRLIPDPNDVPPPRYAC